MLLPTPGFWFGLGRWHSLHFEIISSLKEKLPEQCQDLSYTLLSLSRLRYQSLSLYPYNDGSFSFWTVGLGVSCW